jgi:hypothetical protein
MPLSGGDRKALTKELAKARVMAGIREREPADEIHPDIDYPH